MTAKKFEIYIALIILEILLIIFLPPLVLDLICYLVAGWQCGTWIHKIVEAWGE